MDEKTMIEIMLICKGWYNQEKYKSALEAMSAYYKKKYGIDTGIMDKAAALSLFLQPLAVEAIKKSPDLARCIFEPRYSIVSNKEPFSDVMYERIMGLIQSIPHGTFDTSEYEEMFEKAKSNGYEDKTIGVI